MKSIIEPDGFVRSTGISDEDIDEMAREDFKKLPKGMQALRGKFLVWLAPFRKDGVIETAWDYRDNSCEGVMISDGTGHEIPAGTRVMIHPHEGFEHHINGVLVGFMPESALIFVVEK